MRRTIRNEELPTLVWSVIFGCVLVELWYLGYEAGKIFDRSFNSYVDPLHILIASFGTMCIGGIYFSFRAGWATAGKILKSQRFDLLGSALVGSGISITTGGFGTRYYENLVGKPEIITLFLVCLTPVILALSQIARVLTQRAKKPSSPFFLNDKDITVKEHDLLNVSGSAEKFAKRVLNGGASDSLVFGIDAPWGIGKSSFINLCQEYWAGISKSGVVVHRFEPLRYEQSADLAEKFVEDLIRTIQQASFAPSLRPVFSKYSRMIKGASDFSLFGLRFEPSPTTVEDTLKTLEHLLEQQAVRIIVVVDDLDRVSWDAIKNILFAVKRSFMLPNLSYIFCYDTQNIVSESADGASVDVREFLEKFINVKVSLFLDAQVLAQYVSENFDTAVQNNLGMESRTLDTVKRTIAQLITIYRSPEFHVYQDVIGDVRKIKRLINTLMLLEIDQADFKNSDFDKNDLLHLLLIYVGYPHIFRKIFAAETNGHSGFFSLEVKSVDGASRFRNSENYDNYVGKIESDTAKFLIERLFSYKSLGSHSAVENFDEATRRQRACFNESGSRNLERYLRLIVNLSEPDARETYQFYVNQKDAILAGTSIEDVLKDPMFSFEDAGETRVELWRILANCVRELPKRRAESLIANIVSTLPQYAFSSKAGVFGGPRVKIIYSLLFILNAGRWLNDEFGSDPEEEELFIADWIFGTGEKVDRSIIAELTADERGPLGFYDALLFRLYFSADRGNSLFKLQNALSRHAGPNAPTQGSTVFIAKEGMRKISQFLFEQFRAKYIQTSTNFFSLVDEIDRNHLLGEYGNFLPNPSSEFSIFSDDPKVDLRVERANIKSFIVYQLTNSLVSSGIGCGYYDSTGSADGAGIKREMNLYLFECCFNPQLDDQNYEHFLDFLMTHLARSFEPQDGLHFSAELSEWGKVLDLDLLKAYWVSNRSKILGKKYHEQDKVIKNSSYSVNYNSHLNGIYALLDIIPSTVILPSQVEIEDSAN